MLKKGEGQRGRERKEIILIEGAIKGLVRNMALRKFLGIHRMTPAKTLSSSEEDS